MNKLTRPWSVFLAAVGCFLGIMWFSTAVVDYSPPQGISALKTGPWFILGLPVTLGLSSVYAFLFTWIARKSKVVIAWSVLIALSGFLAYHAFASAMPAGRLLAIVGKENASHVSVTRFYTSPTFGDGTFVYVIGKANSDVVQQIVRDRGLEEWPVQILGNKRDLFRGVIKDVQLPESAPLFGNDQMWMYHDEANGLIYIFCHQGGRKYANQ